jgi:integrase
MARITKRSIDALLAARKPGIIRDDELRGFGCRVNKDGSASYFVEYRAGRGRSFPVRRLVIGRHGPFAPEQARQRAKALLAEVAVGRDPAAKRVEAKKEPTLADILTETLERHWRPKRKASTVVSFAQIITGRLIPRFGQTRVIDLRRSEIRRWHAELRDTPVRANRCLAVLRKALSVAVADEVITVNPAKGIAPHPETPRDRVPSDAELRAVWRACEDPRVGRSAALLFRLLILTGCRVGELRTARRAWLDLAEGVLRLPDGKSGSRTVSLSAQAINLIGQGTGEWLIPNTTDDAPLSSSAVRDAWTRIRALAEVGGLRIHDLRHGFGTRAAGFGSNALVLRDALGHKTLAMTNRYVARQNDPVRELVGRLGEQIEALVAADAPDR